MNNFMNFLPVEMVKAIEVYKEYYDRKTRTLIYSMGTCSLKRNYNTKPMSLSYRNVKNQLNLTNEDIVRLLHSLSSTKYKILNKYLNTKTIGQSDTFEFNAKFIKKMRRIKIPMPRVDEKKKVIEDVDKDRRYAIDACIV